jgi:exosortase
MAFLVSLLGCILGLHGFTCVRILAYPLSMLLLIIAPPTFLYAKATLSLQLLASKLAENALDLLGFSVLREGNVLNLVGMTLSVEEACSGIRSLFAVLFVCALYNYLFVRGTRMRVLILSMAIPMAILGNAVRIIATGIASQYNRALVSGTPHEMLGYITVLLTCLGCIGLHLTLTAIFKYKQHVAT